MLDSRPPSAGEPAPPRPRGLRQSLAEAIGRTPLLELGHLSAGLPARVAVKIEARNPSGSVKDRVAAALVDEAEWSGLLSAGATLVAATSGNTGLALAHLGAARGYKVKLTVPEDWSHERIALLLYLGADVVVTPGGGMKAAVERARTIAKETPGAVLLDQFASLANPEIHRRTTAEEIWQDSGGEVGVFVAGVGTGGTLTGVARGLRAHEPGVRIVAVEPAASAVLSGQPAGPHGIQGIGAGFVPPLLRLELVDEIVPITDERAFTMTARLAREEGVLAGVSSGAAVAAALDIASRPESAGKLVVTMVCDSGERYVTAPRLQGRPGRAVRR
ncbi:MAG TPA: cysteine synthase A [Polyangiaceae bacterium]|jgi:cysteine synthase A